MPDRRAVTTQGARCQAAAGYDLERVDGIEVERVGTDYSYGR
jgi:hypothetical protein